MKIFRPATERDLLQMYTVQYLSMVAGTENPPAPLTTVPAVFAHILRTGTMYVAEQDGQICAFAGSIVRGSVTFLTDLFVHPDFQSAHLGKLLLPYVLPPGRPIRCTMSSTDPRAQALYIRSGMQPQFPNFDLLYTGSLRKTGGKSDVEVVEGDGADPEFARWDARVSGLERAEDHAFWIREQRSLPFWLYRRGKRLGYGYARWVSTLWFPEVCTLGPLGVADPEDAAACVLAATNWALQRSNALRIDLPGPHPGLAPLLEQGFRIVYVETFVSSAATPFFDARCYIPSGADLL